MKKNFCKVISVLLLMTMLLSTGIAAISSSAASEKDYTATFSIETDKTYASVGDEITVSVKLKTNYYIYSMQVPVIYDGDAFEVQNTSPTSLKSYITFKGKLAQNYQTNGNWKSPATYYTSRNSNVDYWSRKSVMDKYKIAYASWSANSNLGDGKFVKLSAEETIMTFVLKAKKDIKNIDGLIFMSEDFLKTTECPSGLWFCGRSKKASHPVDFDKDVVATGQAITFAGSVPENDNVTETDAVFTVNYKATASLKDQLNSTIIKDYKLKWSTADESIVTVDEDGNIYGVKAGTTTVTVKATDSKNSFTKTFNVEVNYSFLQWIIIIVLFGWIWYI